MKNDPKNLVAAYRDAISPAPEKHDALFLTIASKLNGVPTITAPRGRALRWFAGGAVGVVVAVAIVRGVFSPDQAPQRPEGSASPRVSARSQGRRGGASVFDVQAAVQPVPVPTGCQALAGPYVDSSALHAVPFAQRTAWAQPWRAWLETPDVEILRKGIGVTVNIDNHSGDNAEAIVSALAAAGVRIMVVELAWNHLRADEKDFIADGYRAGFERFVRAAQKYGVRPLVRLFGHEILPSPVVQRNARRVAAHAKKGERWVVLDETTGIVPGRTLFAPLGQGQRDTLVVELRENRALLSRPLAADLDARTEVSTTTLVFGPFGPEGSPEYDETARGWLRYVDAVAAFLTLILDTSAARDRGFDLELWQSTTFASRFLSASNYFDPVPPALANHGVAAAAKLILEKTFAHIEANSDRFQGVRVGNGFAGANPEWGCAAQAGQRGALVKRTPGALMWPGYYPKADVAFNARFDEDPWRPPGRIIFPEFQATFLSPESFVRDLAPIATHVDGLTHGRRGRGGECPVWVIGEGLDPQALVPGLSVDRALAAKAKLFARQYTFFLNKGASVVAVAAASRDPSDARAGLASYRLSRASTLPAGPGDLPLVGLGRLMRAFDKPKTSDGTRSTLAPAGLELRQLWDCHGHVQFTGDGSPGRPPLPNRELFTLLPFRVDAQRIVASYYVMTWDVTTDLLPEKYGLVLGGIPADAVVSAYDPLTDVAVPVSQRDLGGGQREVEVSATDYPRVLTIDRPAASR